MYEIKPQRDGWAIWRDGAFVWWCADKEWAEVRLEQLQQEDKNV